MSLAFEGGSISEGDWAGIAKVVRQYDVERVLEFGAGISTQLFTEAGCSVVSMETAPEWESRVREAVPDARVFPWVNGKGVPGEASIEHDLAFVDGVEPRDHQMDLGRIFAPRVVIHDGYRPRENHLVEKLTHTGAWVERPMEGRCRHIERIAKIRPAMLCGYARTGTMSIATLLNKLGVRSLWQPGPLPGDWPGVYTERNIHERTEDFAAKKAPHIHEFEANWALSYFMLPLSRVRPDLEWIVMTRDPLQACNSMRNYSIRHLKNPQTIEGCARKYVEVYTTILSQASSMAFPPKWMSHERFVAQEYNTKLMRRFAVPENENSLDVMKRHFERKVNHIGEYELETTEKMKPNLCPMMDVAYGIKEVVENMLEAW